VGLTNPLYVSTSGQIGDQIRARRRRLGLLQKEVAAKIGVTEDAVRFWESGLTVPGIAQMPAVFDFLDRQPPKPSEFETWGEEIKWHRMVKGLSQKSMSQLLGVDEKTINDWENNRHEPFRKTRERVKRLL